MTAEATEDLPAMPAKGCDEPIGGRPEGEAPPVAHAKLLPAVHRCRAGATSPPSWFTLPTLTWTTVGDVDYSGQLTQVAAVSFDRDADDESVQTASRGTILPKKTGC
jgi:hypothetical protein